MYIEHFRIYTKMFLYFYVQILLDSASNGSEIKFYPSSFLATRTWR